MKKYIFIFFFFSILNSQTINFPIKSSNAIGGLKWAEGVINFSRVDRENDIYNQIFQFGNVPEFLRKPVKIKSDIVLGGNNYSIEYFVLPDYFAIGNDTDYFLIPMTPLLAQKISNELKVILPTRKMVNEIYQNSKLKLPPQPIPPSAAMITMPVFKQHNDSVWKLRKSFLTTYPLGSLIGGTKKDIVISNNIYQNLKQNVPKPVVIYGWHQLNAQPIQPLYNGHEETYADYSHGVRFILDTVLINGEKKLIREILRDNLLWQLFSDEGRIEKPFYTIPTSINLEGENFIKQNFEFFKSYPNPFNNETTFVFNLLSPQKVNLKLFDTLGRELKKINFNDDLSVGLHTFNLDLNNFSSGTYFAFLYGENTILKNTIFKIK